MSNTLTTEPGEERKELSWIFDIPSDMAKKMNVAEGSIAVLHPREGSIEVEVLPPPSQELLYEARETYEEMKEVFEELKRRGD